MNQNIINLLKKNELTELNLSCNHIKNINVFEVLKYNTSLTYLDLTCNVIK